MGDYGLETWWTKLSSSIEHEADRLRSMTKAGMTEDSIEPMLRHAVASMKCADDWRPLLLAIGLERAGIRKGGEP